MLHRDACCQCLVSHVTLSDGVCVYILYILQSVCVCVCVFSCMNGVFTVLVHWCWKNSIFSFPVSLWALAHNVQPGHSPEVAPLNLHHPLENRGAIHHFWEEPGFSLTEQLCLDACSVMESLFHSSPKLFIMIMPHPVTVIKSSITKTPPPPCLWVFVFSSVLSCRDLDF